MPDAGRTRPVSPGPPRPPSGRGAQGDSPPRRSWRSRTWIALDGVPRWEADLFDALNGLSGWLVPVLWAPMQLGSLFGPAIVAIVSWVAWRRWRPTVGALVVGPASRGSSPRSSRTRSDAGDRSTCCPTYVERWGTPDRRAGVRVRPQHRRLRARDGALALPATPVALDRLRRRGARRLSPASTSPRTSRSTPSAARRSGACSAGSTTWPSGVPDDVPGITERPRRPASATLIVNSPPGRHVAGAGQRAGGGEAHAHDLAGTDVEDADHGAGVVVVADADGLADLDVERRTA